MDRLLRGIQVELAPEREPEPALEPGVAPASAAQRTPAMHTALTAALPAPRRPVPPPPLAAAPPPPPPRATPAPPAATDLARHLLASIRELLDGYEQVLVQLRSADTPRTAPAARAPAPGQPRPPTTARGRDADVTVSAGPFASLDALRAFEQSVARLPGVREVAVRGYEGSDRAIIEVRLDAAAQHPSDHTSP